MTCAVDKLDACLMTSGTVRDSETLPDRMEASTRPLGLLGARTGLPASGPAPPVGGEEAEPPAGLTRTLL